ncbi:MAG: C45 family autoproteolytic acyltransferase/hydrolase [Promethearchaeia archaeon]
MFKKINSNSFIKEDDENYAVLRGINNQEFLEVSASDNYRLGRLQGKFVERKVREFKDILKLFSLRYPKFPYELLIEVAQTYQKFIPKHLISEIEGMADSIKRISFEDILLQNCFFDILYGKLIPMDTEHPILHSYHLGCTSFGIIGNNTIVSGQNFDFSVIFKPTLYFSLLKMPGKPNIFSLRMGSVFSVPSGINSFGLSIFINVVKSYAKGKISIPITARTRLIMESYKDVESFYQYHKSVKNTASYNLIVCDGKKLIALENLPENHTKVDVRDYVVRSNTFISEKYQKYLINKEYSKDRQIYAEKKLAELYNSKNISDEALLSVLADYPIICRINHLKPMTLAFLTRKYFGLGNAKNNAIGTIII